MKRKFLLALILILGITSLSFAMLWEGGKFGTNSSSNTLSDGGNSSVTSFLEMLGSHETVSRPETTNREQQPEKPHTPSVSRRSTSTSPQDTGSNAQIGRGDLTALSQTIGGLFGEPETTGTRSGTAKDSAALSVKIREDEIEKRSPLAAPGGPPVPQPAPEQPIATPENSPTPTPTPEDPWVFGQARGYTMLYAMQPEARRTVEAETKILLSARLRQGYIGVLIDGTFGWDPQYLASLIRRLNVEGRTLTLVLYITNGPTMRKFDSTSINTDFSRTSPREFRDDIQFDPVTRDTYQSLARRALPLFSLNQQLNPRNTNIVIPMLEDNLDEKSFRSIAELTEVSLRQVASIVRNPCPGCYKGNDASRNGGRLEVHGLNDLTLATAGDGYSFDGSGYHLRNESGFGTSLPFEQAQELFRSTLVMRLRWVGLWRPDRQGLVTASPIHPKERRYSVPTATHAEAEKILLRFGLPQETE